MLDDLLQGPVALGKQAHKRVHFHVISQGAPESVPLKWPSPIPQDRKFLNELFHLSKMKELYTA